MICWWFKAVYLCCLYWYWLFFRMANNSNSGERNSKRLEACSWGMYKISKHIMQWSWPIWFSFLTFFPFFYFFSFFFPFSLLSIEMLFLSTCCMYHIYDEHAPGACTWSYCLLASHCKQPKKTSQLFTSMGFFHPSSDCRGDGGASLPLSLSSHIYF